MKETNKLLQLTDRIYELTGGLCSVSATGLGLGVSTSKSSSIHLIVSPTEDTDYVEIEVIGYFNESDKKLSKEELLELQDNNNPNTRIVAKALLTLSNQSFTISAKEYDYAFNTMFDKEMNIVDGIDNPTEDSGKSMVERISAKNNKVLQLTERIYDLTGGLCKAIAGPVEIHICHNASMHSSPISLSFDVPSYDEMSELESTDYLDIKTVGYFIDTRRLVTKDDIANLQKDVTPDTQTMLNALLELGNQNLTVTVQDFMDAFGVIIERDMRAADGYEHSVTSNSETEIYNQNTQENESDMEDNQPMWEMKM